MASGDTPWPVGGGAMGAAIRAHDWAATPLGPVDDWPRSLRTAVDLLVASRQPVYIAWGEALASLYNDGYLPILEHQHPAALGRPYPEVFAAIWEEYRPIVAATLAGEAQYFEDRPVALRGPDRPPRWFTFSWTPLRDDAGRVAGFYCAATETTARVHAEAAALRADEARLRLATEAAGMYTWDHDLRDGTTTFSANTARIIGAPVPATPAAIAAYTHPADRARVGALGRRALDAGLDSFEYEFRSVAIPGEERLFHVWCAHIRDDAGVPIRRIGITQDVTAPRRAEAALAASEERYRALFTGMDEAYAVVEVLADAAGRWADFRFLEVNPAFTRHTGMPHPVGRTATELLGTPNPRWAALYGRAADTGEAVRVEEAEPTLGRVFDLNIFRLGGPGSRRVAVLFADITERREREADREFLLDLTGALGRLADERAIVRVAGGRLAARLGLACYHYVDIDEGRGEATVRHFWHAEDVPDIRGTYPLAGFITPRGMAGLRAGVPAVFHDLARELPGDTPAAAAQRAGAAARRIAAYVAAPHSRDGRWTAYFAAADSRPRRWTGREIALSREVAGMVFPRVERARAEAALRASEARQAFLVRISDAARGLADPAAVATIACRMLLEQLGVDRAHWSEVDWTTEEFVTLGSVHAPGVAPIAGRFPLAAWEPYVAAHREGRAVAVDDTQADPRADGAMRAATARLAIGADLAVPVLVGGRLASVLAVKQRRPRRWAREEIALVEGVAGRCWAEVGRARAEAALRESEDRLRRVLDGMGESFGLLAPDFTILEHNREALRMDGRARDEIVGRSHWDAFPGSEASELGNLLRKAMAERVPVSLEHRYAWEAGRALWLEMRAYPTDDGALAVFWRDVTARREAQDALRASEEKYRSLFDSIDEGLTVTELVRDSEGRAIDLIYRECNQAFERLSGLPKEVMNKRVTEVLPHFDPEWFVQYARIAETGVPERSEEYIPDLGRYIRRFMSRIGGAGSPFCAVVFDDITERKLREQQQEFLLTFSDALRAEADADAVARRAIAMLLEQLHLDRCYITFYRPDEDEASFPYQIGNDSVPPLPNTVRLSDFPEAYEQVREKTFVLDDDFERQGLSEAEKANSKALGMRAMVASTARKGGKTPISSLVAVSARPRRWRAGEIALVEEAAERTWAAIERARAEAALRASEARAVALADLVPALLWRADPTGGAIAIQGAWPAYTGQTLAETQDGGWLAAIHPDDRPAAAAAFARAFATGEPLEREQRIRGRDGRYRWFLIRHRPVRDAAGAVATWYGAATDIDDLRRARELAEATVRGRDEFLATAAHELRAPLARLRLSSQLLQLGDAVPAAEHAETLACIERATVRLETLVRDLVDLARLRTGQFALALGPVDLSAVARDAVEEARARAVQDGRRRVDLDLPAALPPVRADAGRLAQALANLLDNAAHASPPRSRIAVRLRREGDGVAVAVRDRGQGLAPGEAEAIFAPFARSAHAVAQEQQGLGLGLAICRGVVGQHGGWIRAESKGVGKGTTVTFWLPAAGPPGAEPRDADD